MEKNRKKIAIVVGAGSTYSDGLRNSLLLRPPLNKGFFQQCKKDRKVAEMLNSVRDSLKFHYDVDPIEESNDYLEDVLVKVYSDILSGGELALKSREGLFLDLVVLLNTRMANTTNILTPVSTSNIRRIVSRYLDKKMFLAPEDVCIVTFNYDLHIEKHLQALDGLKKFRDYQGRIFNFPHLYELGREMGISDPKGGGVPTFARASPQKDRVLLLKLHGSLNWYSKHTSKAPRIRALFRQDREILVTSRANVDIGMQHVGKRKSATYPVIVPPIVGKAAVFHKRIKEIWAMVQTRLRTATEVVIFGYSFPSSDHESVHMLENTVGRKDGCCQHVSVINPDPSVVTRMGVIPKNKPVTIFHSTEEFLACRGCQ